MLGVLCLVRVALVLASESARDTVFIADLEEGTYNDGETQFEISHELEQDITGGYTRPLTVAMIEAAAGVVTIEAGSLDVVLEDTLYVGQLWVPANTQVYYEWGNSSLGPGRVIWEYHMTVTEEEGFITVPYPAAWDTIGTPLGITLSASLSYSVVQSEWTGDLTTMTIIRDMKQMVYRRPE